VLREGATVPPGSNFGAGYMGVISGGGSTQVDAP
jgi:hypothetical protein